MVRIRDMKDDAYFFDEDNYCLRGRKPGNVFTLGDTVRIQVKSADLVKKQLDFVLVKRTEEKKEVAKPKQTEQAAKEGKEKKPVKGDTFSDEWGFEI